MNETNTELTVGANSMTTAELGPVLTTPSAPVQTAPPTIAAPPATAAAPVTTATVGLKPTPLTAPAEPAVSGGVVASVFILILLAVAAAFLRQRGRSAGRMVTILETASIGPKRSLVLAQLNGETFLLGSSEAGITLIAARPGTAPAHTSTTQGSQPSVQSAVVAHVAEANVRASPNPHDAPEWLLNGAGSIGGHSEDEFQSWLVESIEDQELRRKLASGQSGSIK